MQDTVTNPSGPPRADPARDQPGGRRRWSAPVILSLFLAALAWFTFWLFRQPFFDDDYSRWLLPARGLSFGQILRSVFQPTASSWGFLDRPVVTLFFKLLHTAFGSSPAPYFAAKAVLASVLVVLVWGFVSLTTRELRIDTRCGAIGAAIAALVFLTAEPVFMGMLWLCDMDLLAQMFLLAAVLIYLGPCRRSVLRRQGARATGMGILLFFVALCAFRTKGSARLLPVLLLAHAVVVDRAHLRRMAPLILLLFVPIVPWGRLSDMPLPEFLRPAAAAEGAVPSFFWSLPSARSFFALTVGDGFELWPFQEYTHLPYGLVQVLFPFGLLAGVIAGATCVRRLRSQRITVLAMHSPFLTMAVLWLCLVLPTLSIYPQVPSDLFSRYLVALFVPAVLLFGTMFALCWEHASRPVRLLLCLLICGQVASGVFSTRLRKSRTGATLIVLDEMRETVSESCRNATVVHMFSPVYAYWPSRQGNTHRSLQQPVDEALQSLASYGHTASNLVVVTSTRVQEPALRLIAHITPAQDSYNRLTGMANREHSRFIWQKRPDTPFSWSSPSKNAQP